MGAPSRHRWRRRRPVVAPASGRPAACQGRRPPTPGYAWAAAQRSVSNTPRTEPRPLERPWSSQGVSKVCVHRSKSEGSVGGRSQQPAERRTAHPLLSLRLLCRKPLWNAHQSTDVHSGTSAPLRSGRYSASSVHAAAAPSCMDAAPQQPSASSQPAHDARELAAQVGGRRHMLWATFALLRAPQHSPQVRLLG